MNTSYLIGFKVPASVTCMLDPDRVHNRFRFKGSTFLIVQMKIKTDSWCPTSFCTLKLKHQRQIAKSRTHFDWKVT